MKPCWMTVLGIAFGASIHRHAIAEDPSSDPPRSRETPAPAPMPTGSAAPSSAKDEAAAALTDRLARQERALSDLQSALDEDRNARTRPFLRWSGFLQIDWSLFSQLSQNEVDFSRGEPLNQDRFTLRRGHLRASADRGAFSGAVEVDVNTIQGPEVRPIEAKLGVRWPEHPEEGGVRLAFAMGLMRIPFGLEVQEADFERPLLERSTWARALFPGAFDLGAKVDGAYRFVDGCLAVMNGSPIGNQVFPAVAPTSQKDFLGRLGASADLAPGIHLAAGVSAETGTGLHQGTPTTKDQLVWRDENGDGIVQATEVEIIAGSSATPSQTFQRFAFGADARLQIRIPRLGKLGLSGEVVRATNLDRGIEYADPVAAGHDLREFGWHVGATQELTEWAMVGVRYDRYNPDQDASEQRAADLTALDRTYTTLALMAMARYQSVRLVIEYDRNNNALGRDPSGAPTTRQSDAVTLRGQMVF